MKIEPGDRIEPRSCHSTYDFWAIVQEVDEDNNILKVEVSNEASGGWPEDWDLAHTRVGLNPSHGRSESFYIHTKAQD